VRRKIAVRRLGKVDRDGVRLLRFFAAMPGFSICSQSY
jgi:hypothetical protein